MYLFRLRFVVIVCVVVACVVGFCVAVVCVVAVWLFSPLPCIIVELYHTFLSWVIDVEMAKLKD